MYDLPLRLTRERDALRSKVEELGFARLQDGVWVYPYPCAEEIRAIARHYRIERKIELASSATLLHEARLLKVFNLKAPRRKT